MGPIWGRQDPGGPHVGPMNFVILAPQYVANVATPKTNSCDDANFIITGSTVYVHYKVFVLPAVVLRISPRGHSGPSKMIYGQLWHLWVQVA